MKIIILYTDAGGGHKSTALTLQESIQNNTNWQVQLLNPFKEVCAEFDISKRLFRLSAEDLYNRYVSENHSALLKLLIISAIFKINLAIPYKKIVRKLTATWDALDPDLVISVTPFINEHVAESLQTRTKTVPFVTLITDFQECCKNIWITSGQPQNLICCSSQLVIRAEKFGFKPQNIFRISGMLVSGKFYSTMQRDRNQLRAKLGLQAGIPTALVAFGSHGSEDMLTIAQNLRNCPIKLQVVFICGYDQKLKTTLQNLTVDYPLIATGFVHNVDEYMHCADIFIGKPGGLSVAEAAIMHLPMILKYNLFTLIHERHNAQWVLDHKFGITVKNLAHMQQAVKEVLDNEQQFAARFKTFENRAYFEIIPILEEILGVKSHTSPQILPAASAHG